MASQIVIEVGPGAYKTDKNRFHVCFYHKTGPTQKMDTFYVQKTTKELQLMRTYRICNKYTAATNVYWSFIHDAPDHPAITRPTISDTRKFKAFENRKTSYMQAYQNIVEAKTMTKYPSLYNLTFFSQESWLNISVTSTKCRAPIYLITGQC